MGPRWRLVVVWLALVGGFAATAVVVIQVYGRHGISNSLSLSHTEVPTPSDCQFLRYSSAIATCGPARVLKVARPTIPPLAVATTARPWATTTTHWTSIRHDNDNDNTLDNSTTTMTA
ncbi:hypothetical protein EDB83DRAFT_2310876 [Lactarius deliciosus]|nr:hypothetical protein EDB83DRAFT_2310876 [Lactarius deliciosus]